MDHDDVSSLAQHIEDHLSFLRAALSAGNPAGVREQAKEIEGWASSIAEAASEDQAPPSCHGHEPGPGEPMGVTVYCDGSCRRVKGSRA